MTSVEPTDQTPEVEVTVWLDGDVVERRYCDTVEEANDLAELWADRGSVQINVHLAGAGETSDDDPIVPMEDEPVHDTRDEEAGR